MRLETRRLEDLKPAEYNPRKPLTPSDSAYQDIKRSITELGYCDPIVINYDGTIIKGHQRRTVMMDLGIEEAEVVVLNIRDKNKEKQANIALNKITGQWDLEKLKTVLVDLDLEGYDFTVTGFQQPELEDLIQQLDIPPEAQEDDFDPDAKREAITEPVTARGDIWKLGRHRLMCGDATLEADMEALLAGEQMDLVITDPPYNVDYAAKDKSLERAYKRNQTRATSEVKGDQMSLDTFYCFLVSAFRNINYAMRPGAAIYVFHADVNGLYFRQAYREAGLKMAQCLIWEKNNFVLGHNDYQWRHEPILYGWKEGAGHYFIRDRSQDSILLEDEADLKKMGKRELLAYIENYIRQYKDLTTVHFEPKPQRSNLHPTMKPIPLIGRFMNNSSKPAWNVGDFFGGSGSTLMAAEQLGRTAFLMEIDERNCDVIIQRWEEFTGQKAVRL